MYTILFRSTSLIAIIQFLIITAISAAFARRIIGKHAPSFDTKGERLIFESAIGLGLLGLLIFVLGVAQLFYLPAFLILLAAMTAVSWGALSGVISDVISGIRGIRNIKWNLWTVVTALILTGIGVLVLLRALAPPSGDDWDSLAYHLAIPKLFLAHHGIYYVQFASHSNFPFTWEMLYTLGLAFGSVSLAKLFHFGAGVLLVGAIYSLTRRHFGAKSAPLATLIAAGIPILTWEASTAYIDLATALYSFLAVYALLNYSSTKDRKWAILAGVMVGIAAGTKMTALGMIGIAVVWILWPSDGISRSIRIKTAAICAGIAVIIAAPWYIKTFIYTGNPVYPFFYGLLGGRNWSIAAAEFYRTDQLKFGLGRDAASFLTLPWDLTFRFIRFVDFGARIPRNLFELPICAGNPLFFLSSIGPMFLASVPIIASAALKKGVHRPLLAVSLTLIAMWFFMMQNTRYLIPALVLLAPAIAFAAETTGTRKVMTGVAALSGAFTIFLLATFTAPSIPTAIGTDKPANYLENSLDIFRTSKFINENAPKDAKVALLGETRGFYIDRSYIWADPMNNPTIPYDRMSNPDELIKWFKSQKISYAVINRSNFPDGTKADAPAYAKLAAGAFDSKLVEVYTSDNLDPTHGIAVYLVK